MLKTASLFVALAIFGCVSSVEKDLTPMKVDSCTCVQNGNIYQPYSTEGCTSFHQKTKYHPGGKIKCLAGQVFDVDLCTCNWKANVNYCPVGCQEKPKVEKPVVLDRTNVSCIENGNIYAIMPGSNCEKFGQLAIDGSGQTKVHECPHPDILGFDVNLCVCNLKERINCVN